MALSKNSAQRSRLHLTDKDMAEVKNHAVGSKHTFIVHAELVKARKNEGTYEDMEHEPMGLGVEGKPKIGSHSVTGEYKIHSIMPHKGGKDLTAKGAKKSTAKPSKVGRYADKKK